jgi:hypothetical protein
MLTELRGKGGCVCQLVREGRLRCPLIVRPTSEDVITGHLFQTLGVINPRWWLPDLLNQAMGAERFRRQLFRELRIDLWQKRVAFPRSYLPWGEGPTEVDATIRWNNPPTTIFIEMKFTSPIAPTSAGGCGHDQLPSDQLARNIRVGLHECGYYGRDRLFPPRPRDFAVVIISPTRGQPLIQKYRREGAIWNALPRPDLLLDLPRRPFVGEISYGDIATILRSNERWLTRAERDLAGILSEYLLRKTNQMRSGKHEFTHRQEELFSEHSPTVESDGSDK